MSESKYQAKIIKEYERMGWYVVKLIQTNKNGIPDLLLMKHGEAPFFIELKSARGKIAPLQRYRIEEILKETGYKTIVLSEPHLTP